MKREGVKRSRDMSFLGIFGIGTDFDFTIDSTF